MFDLFIYTFCGLCIFALVLPTIAIKQRKTTYLFIVVFSIAQLVLYHQFFRWDILGVLWRDFLFAFLLISVLIGLHRRDSHETSNKLFTIMVCSVVVVTSIFTKWGLPIIVNIGYPDRIIMDITSPFQAGNYFVAQGGPYKFYNFNHQTVAAQMYAYDITKIDTLLSVRGKKLIDNQPSDYYSMSIVLLAPCSGKIVHVSSIGRGQSDIEKKIEQLAGNSVAIECSGNVIAMAHMNTVFLEKDTIVVVGMPIGTLGNTGRSSDPHLHIHAVSGPYRSIECTYFECKGIPLRIDNRLLVKNDVF